MRSRVHRNLKKLDEIFDWFACQSSRLTGKPLAFLAAVMIVVVWALTGPLFGYSDTWQLVINTGTTVITFLMVFLIQHSQNRDTLALQLKLSELILAVEGARNRLAAVEDFSDRELERLKKKVRKRANGDPDARAVRQPVPARAARNPAASAAR
jgi:low affinity Fe/Cu permease